ncbi:hypothetical protein APHAL10511_007077 [Amanita phalloides]|nr:hypothetical protein APHAL10511_007077 [Amanita phalloides]
MAGVANIQGAFVIFGDSITQGSFEPEHRGFGQRLAHVYARRLDVLNRGLSGYNTDWGLPVLKQCVVKTSDNQVPKIKVVTIWFGANDSCILPSAQHVPLDKFVANLHEMISIVRGAELSHNQTRIMLLTPPPVNTHQRAAALAARDPPQACDRIFLTTKQYAEAVLAVGAAEDVAVVDVWSAMYKAADEDEEKLSRFLVDGLHPNEAGYQLVYEQLINTICDRYPDVHYENIPYTFPPWAEINWKSPEESLLRRNSDLSTPPSPERYLFSLSRGLAVQDTLNIFEPTTNQTLGHLALVRVLSLPSSYPPPPFANACPANIGSMLFLDRLIESTKSSYQNFSFIDTDLEEEMSFFNPSSTYLVPPSAPSRKRSQRFSRPPREDVDDFLSSDLEVSFASTVSLHSPPRRNTALPQDKPSFVEPMDISPAPMRPRAYTSAARLFGSNIGNTLDPSPHVSSKPPKVPSIHLNGKSTQRSGLPLEWIQQQPVLASVPDSQPTDMPATLADDAMDLDTSFIETNDSYLSSSPVVHSAAPTATAFNNLFFDTMSPRRSLDSPSGPQSKKRRSLSPEHVRLTAHDNSSSPSLLSSPSQNKLDRMSGTNLFARFKDKPKLEGLGNPPPGQHKRTRKPALSATILPSGMQSVQSAYPSMDHFEEKSSLVAPSPPVRRTFSALIPSSMCSEAYSDESSIDGPDMSSPAQAYTKRQQVRTLRRRDGTEDFRPLTGASPSFNKESPSAKFLAPGLPGFGDNEAHGKILPCHKVSEDGLMRINCKTLDDLLDGKYKSRIAKFLVIDCRFDYEYSGGHVPGAININTTTAVEELLLGPSVQKPKPSVSGDFSGKTILVFHCEFSAKRAPTFAKHLRAKDRAMNNQFYPKIYYPEVYVLEGGYCQYFRTSPYRCEPPAYVRMDDPKHLASRREDLDQFRKVKFSRYKSYAFGDLGSNIASQSIKRNTAPIGAPSSLFSAANAARNRRCGNGGGTTLLPLAEDTNIACDTDTDTDIGDSPCPPPTRTATFKGKKIGRAPLTRAETYPIRMPL